MQILPEILRQIVLKSGFVSEKDFDAAAKTSQDLQKPIADILLFRGLISETVLGQLIAEYLQVPYVSIGNKVIPFEVLGLIPENLAKTYKLIPFKKENNFLHLAMQDPKDLEAQEVIRRKTGLKVIPYYITLSDFRRAASQYKRNIKEEFERIIAENIKKN